MSMKKRLIPILLSLMVCISFFSAPSALAANGGSPDIMPMMEYINDSYSQFSITGGSAKMFAEVLGNAGTTKCEVNIELQVKGLIFWDTVDSWSTSRNATRAELEVSEAVTSGKTYRMVAEVTVWRGSASESKTLTSSSIKA